MARAFGKSVIIGLGGTGQKALIRIKKMFLDHCGGKLPPCVKLLAFDTSSNQEHIRNARGEKITFDSDEFCHMRIGSIREVINNQYVQRWWIPYPALDRCAINEGSGGIRQVGRLAVFVNIDTIRHKIEKAFSDIDRFGGHEQMADRNMELLSITPQVYVIGSFAGGTGSGSFVDFSILCRSLGGMKMFYSAFFVMPWIYRNAAKTAYENGYAALLELERLNDSSPSQKYEVQYGPDAKLEFSLEDRPYHIVNLIDGKCRNGYKIDKYEDLSQFIGECIFNSVGAIGKEAGDVVVNNIMTVMNISQPSDWKNRPALYSTFGVSSIVYPGAEIHERASIEYACDLVDLSMQHIKAPETLPLEEMNNKEVQPFIVEKGLVPHQHGLLKKILPENAFGSYVADDQIDLRDSNLKSVVKGDLDRWEKRQINECTRTITENGENIKKEVAQASKDLMERIIANEKAGSAPKGSYEAANKLFLEAFTSAQDKLSKEKETKTQELDIAKEKLEACSGAFPDPPPRFPFSTSPVRIAYRNYADARMQVLSINIAIQKMEKAIELYATWVGEAKKRNIDIDKGRDLRDSVQTKLMDVKSALLTRCAGLGFESLLKQKSLFEIYVGIQTEEDKDIFISRKQAMPLARDDFKEFLKANKITDRNSLDAFNTNQLQEIFMQYARQRLKPATDFSVLEALQELERRKEGTVRDIIAQAMRNSSLLLPIDNDKLAAKQDKLSEFTVIGGEDGKKLMKLLENHIPQSTQVQNLWASTGDKYRITLCNYFAAIPLYVLKDIKEIRSAYLERIYPPAHSNKNFVFELPDILPESFVEILTLKLLSLSMLNAVSLITHVQRRNGTKYYKMDPKVIGKAAFIDEEELQLPGKPGKFYSLYEEVCKDETLQERLEQALLKLDEQPGFREKLMEDMEKTYNEFKEKLKTKDFHKRITGNLYYQQATFYREMLKNRWSITKALGL